MITECLSIKCALQKYSNEAKDFELYEIYREYCFSSFRAGTIHKVRTLKAGGRWSRQKRTSIVFITSLYCLKAYKVKEGI